MQDFNTRVLIVDDQEEIHTDFQEILSKGIREIASDDLADAFLEEDSQDSKNYLPAFELSHASSGDEAYEMVKAAAGANLPFAVAYVDIRMPPGMDGIETIRQIREFEKNLEIVIMTAYTDKPLHEIVTNMELLHKLLYIRKPVAREEIQQITFSLVEKWNVEQAALKQQQELSLSHQRLEAVLDSTGDAIGTFDGDGTLLFANQWYCRLFDIASGDLGEMSETEVNARVNARFRELALPEAGRGAAAEDVQSVLEETTDSAAAEPRLFYCSTTSVKGSDGADKVVSYRDMSKDAKIQQLHAEIIALRTELGTTYSFDEIIGKSEKMQQLYAEIQTATEGDITVLIQGESGTGKELVAKSIHYNSRRKSGPFVAVNCAAIPENLIESELFGHERGAFTGASARRIGKFEQANTGTLFLDEIGDMQPALQAKLLRVLEDRQFQRVGGTSTISTDIRVLTATNQDLAATIESGDFRLDLYYRIAAFRIVIPPLRERREDIPILANHFVKKYADATEKTISAISVDALDALIRHDFPGNVRELENAIESAVLIEATDLLQLRSLPLDLSEATPHVSLLRDPADPAAILPLDEVERRTIREALAATDNNISAAARALGIDRSTLHRKLKQYDLPG